MEDVISLDVRDDGVGFDPAALPADGGHPAAAFAGPGDQDPASGATAGARSAGGGPADGADRADGGFGLIGMRQRVSRLAGELTVESEPGNGTAVSATVPAVPAGAAA
jgi:signal transduction histidine kinase